MSAGKHTIILVQYSNSFQVKYLKFNLNSAQRIGHRFICTLCLFILQSRSYMEFPSVGGALDALVKMYEHKLKELNPSVVNITYDISDLYQYLDSLQDLCGLV